MREAVCPVCPHHCALSEGAWGRCGARRNRGGRVVCESYGKLTSIALDPIEKKPLAYFYPGRKILSVGSFGCNMACPFCQNHEIADVWEDASRGPSDARHLPETFGVSPAHLCRLAAREREHGNIGVAFTYNEPLVGYEYVRDAAKLVHEAGMKNVLVTNGMAARPVLEALLPYIDAMNIDLKGFRPEIYRYLGGDLETVKAFIVRAAADCHVELTTLIVPGMNDDPQDMEAEAAWIAGIDPSIPLHITRYFPRHRLQTPATDIAEMRQLSQIASQKLSRVRLGNV